MVWPAIIAAGGAILGGAIGARATEKAASETAAAANRAAELQREAQREALALQTRMYEENVARQQPYYDVGVNALRQLPDMAGAMPEAFTGQVDLTSDPGYAFRLQEGLKALERSAAARGGLLSGGTGKALTRYGQDVASQEYGNAYNRALTEYNALRQREAEGYNRLAGLAGVGGTTAQQLGVAGQNYATGATNMLAGTAQRIGDIGMRQGDIAGQAALTRGTMYGQALGGLGSVLGKYYGQQGPTNYLAPVENRMFDTGQWALGGPGE